MRNPARPEPELGSPDRTPSSSATTQTVGASVPSPAVVGPDVRVLLERWIRASTTPQRVVRRSRIVLLKAAGLSDDAIASQLGISRPTVRLWVSRFEAGGPQTLLTDAPGRGRHGALEPEVVQTRLRQADLLGPDGRPVSLRRASALLGVSHTTVWRACKR